MRIIKTMLALLPMVWMSVTGSQAQNVALKTNLLYWGTTTPNLSLEIATGKRTTLDILGGYNPWTFGTYEADKKIQHWVVQPEFRIWTCEKFNRGFFGFHVHGGEFNVGNMHFPLNIFPGVRNHRYEGSFFGGGVSYGWQWYLGAHWNLEATFGFGYAYMDYKQYDCGRCGEFQRKGHKHYWGPTRIGLSFVYLFKSKR